MNRWPWSVLLLSLCLLVGSCQSHRAASAIDGPPTQDMEGQRITIRGTAQNSKAGAMAGDYFIDGLSSWPDDVLNHEVEATGMLRILEQRAGDLVNSKGEYSQGMAGEQYILQNADWRVTK